jgi:hypothetical protein
MYTLFSGTKIPAVGISLNALGPCRGKALISKLVALTFARKALNLRERWLCASHCMIEGEFNLLTLHEVYVRKEFGVAHSEEVAARYTALRAISCVASLTEPCCRLQFQVVDIQ